MPAVERILVPLDLSPVGEVKLSVAEGQARAFDAEVILLHVLPEQAAAADGSVSPQEAGARAYLDALAARLHAAGVRAWPLVRFGPVAATVLDAARDQDVDLIILGSTVRAGLARLFPRGVADEIVRNAPCPVLLVRPALEAAPTAPAVRSFADDAARAGPVAPRSLGLRTVEVARIVGSVGRPAELGGDFRPRQPWPADQNRHQNVLWAMSRGEAVPPVELYKLGYGYYVLDGHHRVAAAKQLDQRSLEAIVTEFVPLADVQAQRVFSERRAFEQATGLTRIGLALPGHYPRLLELIRADAERQALGEPSAGAGPALRQAAARWDAEVFQPLQRQIRAQRLGQHFPGERTADVFLRVADYRRDESERQGRELSWDEALQGFAAAQRARHASTDGAG